MLPQPLLPSVHLSNQTLTNTLSFIVILFLGSLVREEGLGSLFRGWLPTVLRESLGNAAFFAAYHHTKNTLSSRHKSTANGVIVRGGSDGASLLTSSNHSTHSVIKTGTTTTFSNSGCSSDISNALSNVQVKSNRAQSHIPVKLDDHPVKDKAASSTGAILLAGAMAGLAYTLCSHPLEIAAILMQVGRYINVPCQLMYNHILKYPTHQ